MEIDDIVLICNGEIYNHKQLFNVMNINPNSNSDCEVIIHLYKKYGIEQNKDDIELFTKILKVIRNTIDMHLSFTETEKKLYGTNGVTQLLVRTSRIVLNAKYEIYNNLFGELGKEDGVKNYDDALIDRIDYLLKNLHEPTFANIRYEMRDKVDLFLSGQRLELEKLISS